MKTKNEKGGTLIALWIAFGVMIILGFFAFSMIIAGSAGNGYQEDGRFLLGNTAHMSKFQKQFGR